MRHGTCCLWARSIQLASTFTSATTNSSVLPLSLLHAQLCVCVCVIQYDHLGMKLRPDVEELKWNSVIGYVLWYPILKYVNDVQLIEDRFTSVAHTQVGLFKKFTDTCSPAMFPQSYNLLTFVPAVLFCAVLAPQFRPAFCIYNWSPTMTRQIILKSDGTDDGSDYASHLAICLSCHRAYDGTNAIKMKHHQTKWNTIIYFQNYYIHIIYVVMYTFCLGVKLLR